MNDDFYIGWEDHAPAGLHRWNRRVIAVLVCLMAGLATVLALSQRTIGRSSYDWKHEQRYSGILRRYPVPCLEVIDVDGGLHSHLLVAPWKHGFSLNLAEAYDGRRVELAAKRIQHDDHLMLETALDSVTLLTDTAEAPLRKPPVSLGTQTLTGEIVDSKCWFGVMNPGRLTPHRGCAVRCISGGIPPILLVQYDSGRTEHYLLLGSDGRPLNRELLDWVAEPVRVTGEVVRHGDLRVLKAELTQVRRIESREP